MTTVIPIPRTADEAYALFDRAQRLREHDAETLSGHEADRAYNDADIMFAVAQKALDLEDPACLTVRCESCGWRRSPCRKSNAPTTCPCCGDTADYEEE